jgi:steroid Delta-isomerase
LLFIAARRRSRFHRDERNGMSEQMTPAKALAHYIQFYQELKPDTLDRLDRLVVFDVHFKDPFNDFKSRDKMKAVFRHMFDTLDQPRFIVRDSALSERTAYLRWSFGFRGRSAKPFMIEGMSEVRFDLAGQATMHIDHWDAAEQFYERLPLIGAILRLIKAKFRV